MSMKNVDQRDEEHHLGLQVVSLLACMLLWHSTAVLLVCTVLAGSVGLGMGCWELVETLLNGVKGIEKHGFVMFCARSFIFGVFGLTKNKAFWALSLHTI